MTTYGYARSIPWQGRRNRHPAESAVAPHRRRRRRRPYPLGLNGLLEAIRAGDALLVTALDRLGRDTLGLLELINRLATMGVDLKVLDMPVDAQDVAGGGQLVALVTARVAAIERANISRRTKQGLKWARAEGKLAGRRWSISRAWMRTING